jgi:hypothetical protein
MVESTLNVPSFKSHFAVDKILAVKERRKEMKMKMRVMQ